MGKFLKSLITLIGVTLISVASYAVSPVTVSGNLQSITSATCAGGTGGTNCFIQIRLRNYGGVVPTVVGTGVVVPPQVQIIPDASGSWSTNLWGNDNIRPNNCGVALNSPCTFYSIDFMVGGKQVSTGNWSFTGAGPFNLNSYPSIQTTPPPPPWPPIFRYVDMFGSSSPGNPSLGYCRLYFDTNLNSLTGINSSGAPCLISGGGSIPVGVAAGSQLVSNGVGFAPAYQTKPMLDIRDSVSGLTGAVCDGVTDDQPAIQRTVTAAVNGGVVYIPRTANGCFISTAIQAVAGVTFYGEGRNSKIVIPSAGWNMSSTSIYGIISIKNVNNVRVTGLHIVGNGAGGVDAVHTPKLIYFENANNVQIDHNELEQSGCEGIWNGGAQTANTNIDVGDNSIHDMELQSAFGACDIIPAIQMNADYAIIHNNRLQNVGVGVGFSGGHGSVTGNIVQNPKSQGFSTGDSNLNGPVTFAGNEVDVTVNGAVGFKFNGGISTDVAVQVSGNTCYAHGGAAISQTCFWVGTAPFVNLSGNTAVLNYKGTGFNYNGSTTGTVVNSSGNTCRGQTETASTTCFIFLPNGGGNTLTVNSTGDQVYGITRANGSTAFSDNGLTGTLNLTITGDTQSQGQNNFVANGSGQIDGQTFSFYSLGKTTSANPLTPASTFSISQGSGQFYTSGASGLFGSMVCLSADNTVSKCPASSGTNVIGQALGTAGAGGGMAVQTSGYSNQPLVFDGTYSPAAGWYACASTTGAGQVKLQVGPCLLSAQVGIVPLGATNITNGRVILNISYTSWAIPGTIGSITPNTGAFTTVSATGQVSASLFSTTGGAGKIIGVTQIMSSTAVPTDFDGEVTLSGGVYTYTFTNSYLVHPICIANDETTIAAVKVTYTGTLSVTFTTVGATDVVSYICGGRS